MESLAACGTGVSPVFCEVVGFGDPTYATKDAIFKGMTEQNFRSLEPRYPLSVRAGLYSTTEDEIA